MFNNLDLFHKLIIIDYNTMNTFRKLYKDFFGLREAKINVPASKMKELDPKILNDPKAEITVTEKTKPTDLDEAELINNITDYRGGVEYVVRDPAEGKQVSAEIRDWAEKKGFVVLKQKVSANGKIGYFYFKLGQDPALESQRIQGYIAQKPEIKHFRFNVRGQRKAKQRTENPSM